MGGAPCFGASPLDTEFTNEIKRTVDRVVGSIPSSYTTERNRIVEKMRQAAPNPYENLQYADYPDKNGARVNALASKNVTSNEAKKRMAKQINEELEPRVNEKTVDYDHVTRMAARKAVEKTVEEFVDKAVDEFIKNINNIDKQAKP